MKIVIRSLVTKQIPAFLGSSMATQVSCSGLGSEAEAREDANAMRATATRRLTPFFIVRVLCSTITNLCVEVRGEKFCMENMSIYRRSSMGRFSFFILFFTFKDKWLHQYMLIYVGLVS